jgi:acyl transferase domain-containing protein
VVERDLPFECIALVLQGGGALGAYQAGVYEALAEAGIYPDWVAGISIGAINCAIIAGTASLTPGRSLIAGTCDTFAQLAFASAPTIPTRISSWVIV